METTTQEPTMQEITVHMDRDLALAFVEAAGFIRETTGAQRYVRTMDGEVVEFAFQLDEALGMALAVLAWRL